MKKAKKKLSLAETLSSLKRLLSYAGGYRWLFIAAFVFALASSVLTHIIPKVFSAAIELAVGPGNVNMSGIVTLLMSVPVMILSAAASELVLRIMAVRLGSSIIRNIRTEAFRKINRLPLSYLDTHSSGDLLSRIISDADRMSDGILTGIVSLYSSVLGIVVTLVFMFTVSPAVAAIVVILTPMSMLVASFISSRTYSLFKKSAGLSAGETSLTEEYIGGTNEIKLFGREKACSDEFDRVNEEYRKVATKAVFFASLTNPVTRFVNSVIYAGVALTGGLLTASGMLGVSGFTVLLTYSREYAKPFNDLSGVLAEAQNALASAMRIFELLDAEEMEKEADGLPEISDENRMGTLSAENVCFSYTERPFMENLNFSAPQG
ncbi:MAG: ABC transporter ATP-binding protein, partial [Clostridia bacterium]|nr:ABC transporter ATP-binding protein [Clostridia bacterium]